MRNDLITAMILVQSGAALAHAGITFHQPLRSASAMTEVNGATQTITSTTLALFEVTAQESAPAIVNGQTVDTEAIAAISCTFDPTSVKGRCRFHGQGFATAKVTASSVIDVLVTVDQEQPWRIHSSNSVFVPGGLSTLNIELTSQDTGQVLFATASGDTGVDRIDARGVLLPGTYHFLYEATLVDSDGGSDRDFTIRLEVPCPADLDDGTGTGQPDGGVLVDDLLYFLGKFEVGDLAADLTNGAGQPLPDDAVNIEDLLYFLERFEVGC